MYSFHWSVVKLASSVNISHPHPNRNSNKLHDHFIHALQPPSLGCGGSVLSHIFGISWGNIRFHGLNCILHPRHAYMKSSANPICDSSFLTTPCISRESHSSSTYLSCKSLILCNDTHRKPGKMLLCDVAPLRERAYSRMIRRSAGFISGRAGSASSSEGWYHCMVTSVSVLNRTTLSDGLCGSGVLPGGGGTLGCRQQMSNGLTVSVCL